MPDIVVLGAGLQGVCAALALAREGHRVTVIDREPACLSRASLHNEGKIHLGFVYANDRTSRTSSLMLEAALSFGPLLEKWMGVPVPWADYTGLPFSYLILRDTLVPADQLLNAWRHLEADYQQRRSARRSVYLGTMPDRLWRCNDTSDRLSDLLSERVSHIVHTSELALDMPAFRTRLEETLRNAGAVRCLFNHEIREVARVPGGFRVDGTNPDGASWTCRAPIVVNCLWEGRLAIDRQLGLLPDRPWVYRLKCRLLGQLPPHLTQLASLTMMCGRFGDVVNYGGGRVYLSWYPASLQGWSSDVEVPSEWEAISRGRLPADRIQKIVSDSLAAFETIIPGFSGCRIDSLAGGVIFSWGQTDIDDPASELHRRDDIGPAWHDGYITVNTGKLTAAPLFAARIVDMIAP